MRLYIQYNVTINRYHTNNKYMSICTHLSVSDFIVDRRSEDDVSVRVHTRVYHFRGAVDLLQGHVRPADHVEHYSLRIGELLSVIYT